MPAHANVETARAGSVPVVRISGELDLENVPQVARSIEAALPREADGLVLDLSELLYLDSTGIRLLVELQDRLAGSQVLALVVPADAPVSAILALVKLELIVPIYPDVGAAARAVGEREDPSRAEQV